MRFVVLHHTDFGETHFDLMIESSPGSTLITWRSPCWPIQEPTVVKRLDNHRPSYLQFEGKISGDRGQVRRVASGEGMVHSAERYQLGDTWVSFIGSEWIAEKTE